MAADRGEVPAGLALFAEQLRAHRARAGWSRDELAARVNYSPSLVGMVEAGSRAPTAQFAAKCDEAFGTPGDFARLQEHSRTVPLPEWFRAYADAEAAAVQLRTWQPLVMYGLLQTEDYARAVLATRPDRSDDEIETLVSARMERQAILSRSHPPRLWVVLDEAVLQRPAGGRKVMHEQLAHLWGMADRPNVTVEIVPLATGVHAGISGAFDVAESGDGGRVGYLDTASHGVAVESHSGLADLMLTFDTLRSEALPRGASRDMIMKWADHYDGPG